MTTATAAATATAAITAARLNLRPGLTVGYIGGTRLLVRLLLGISYITTQSREFEV